MVDNKDKQVSELSHTKKRSVTYVVDDHTYTVHEYDLDLNAHQMNIFGTDSYINGAVEGLQDEPGVEFSMANRVIRNLTILQNQKVETKDGNPKPILIQMHTCGGMWGQGMAILRQMRACPNPITIINLSEARSMSSLIFQGASKRVMLPGSEFMLHRGSSSTGDLNLNSFVTEVNQNLKSLAEMVDIYIHKMKTTPHSKFKSWSKARIHDFLHQIMDKKQEVYLSAEETVDWGLADEIFGSEGTYNHESLLEYEDYQLSTEFHVIPKYSIVEEVEIWKPRYKKK